MIIKPRNEPADLILLRKLKPRKAFTDDELSIFNNLVKGYEGETYFEKRMSEVKSDILVMNDLLFEMHRHCFQIDSLIISAQRLYLIEIKNYGGDYTFDSAKNRFFSNLSRAEINNPLTQLNQCEALFRQLLSQLRYDSSRLEGQVIFVNPEFMLYNADQKLPVIFPSQLNRFIDGLNRNSVPLSDHHHQLSSLLIKKHLHTSPYDRPEKYDFESLRKGIFCPGCEVIYSSKSKHCFHCKKCGFSEKKQEALLRTIEEFMFLFKDTKITTQIIYKWCGGMGAIKLIRQVLKEHFYNMGHTNKRYYVQKCGN